MTKLAKVITEEELGIYCRTVFEGLLGSRAQPQNDLVQSWWSVLASELDWSIRYKS